MTGPARTSSADEADTRVPRWRGQSALLRRPRLRGRSAWNSASKRCADWDSRRDLQSNAQAARAAVLSREPRSSAWPICMRHLPIAESQVVMSLRGGYGSNYILPGLDLELDPATSEAVLCLQRSDRGATALAG